MKYLLFLLPFFSFGQEVVLGVQGSPWTYNDSIVIVTQEILDSINYGKYTVDSVSYQNDTTVNIHFHNGGDIYSDIIFGGFNNDTLWTTPDIEMYKCYNSCKALYECGGCYKTTSCGCACLSGGLCQSENLGINISLGALIRNKLIEQ